MPHCAPSQATRTSALPYSPEQARITQGWDRATFSISKHKHIGLVAGLFTGVVAKQKGVAVDTEQQDAFHTHTPQPWPVSSSGNDLTSFSQGFAQDRDAFAAEAAKMLESFVDAFIEFPKPLVAAVNGPAFGIAATTIGLCDFVYASPQAFFATPFVSLGQSPEGCSSLTFPAVMGHAKANEVLLMGKRLSAQEAAACGFVSEVIEHDDLKSTVAMRARKLASMPPQSLQLTKGVIRSLAVPALKDANRRECELLRERWVSDECAQALLEFVNKNQ
eukprot:m.226533 g.226533  ORF g.226533 m.226533 type:complete len:276 (+) comp18800_c0_seq1:1741-2568(+)